MTNFIRVSLLGAAIALLAINSGITSATADQPSAPSASASPYSVHIKNFAFDPATLTVPAGATVIFKNEDTVAHTASATGKNGFDSGNLDSGGQFKHIFSKTGRIDYTCSYHPNMKGTIIVTEAGAAASPTPFVPPNPSGY